MQVFFWGGISGSPTLRDLICAEAQAFCPQHGQMDKILPQKGCLILQSITLVLARSNTICCRSEEAGGLWGLMFRRVVLFQAGTLESSF